MGPKKKSNADRKARHSVRNVEDTVPVENTDNLQTDAGTLPAQSEDSNQPVRPEENDRIAEDFDFVKEIDDLPAFPETCVTSGGDQGTNVADTGGRLIAKDDSTESLDILGNGSVIKRVILKGLGVTTRPNHGDMVVINYKGWLEDGGALVDDVKNFSFPLGDGDVIHALELALPLAELNETFELLTDARFAYGSLGREPDIPGNAKVRYEVHLISVNDPPNYRLMSADERLKAADQKRERGNFYYGRGEYAYAVNSYNKALEISIAAQEANFDGKVVDVDNSESTHELEMKLHNNLAATQIKIEAFEAAIKSCDAVLLHDPENFKALYRKGKALLGLGEASKAIAVLDQVRAKLPSNQMVLTELQRARAMLQRERDRWSRASSRLFPEAAARRKPATARQKWRLFSVCGKQSTCLIVIAACVACLAVAIGFLYPEKLKQSIGWTNPST